MYYKNAEIVTEHLNIIIIYWFMYLFKICFLQNFIK